jgi:hypothetical protein
LIKIILKKNIKTKNKKIKKIILRKKKEKACGGMEKNEKTCREWKNKCKNKKICKKIYFPHTILEHG